MGNLMLARLRLSAIAVLCGCHMGCMSGAAPAAADAPAASWQLSVNVDGGIAGISQRFTIVRGSTNLVAVDAIRGAEISDAITEPQRQELDTYVAARSG